VVRALHAGSFRDDPTRVLRAARFMARLEAHIDVATETWARETVAAGLLNYVSGERLRTELLKLVAHPSRRAALQWLEQLGVMQALESTWQVNLPLVLERRYLAALRWASRHLPQRTIGHSGVHDLLNEDYQWFLLVASSLDAHATGRLSQRLRMPNVVASAMRQSNNAACLLPQLDAPDRCPVARARALADVPDSVCLIVLAMLAHPLTRRRLRRYLIARRMRPPLLSGHDLTKLGVPHGPAYRRMLDEARIRQLGGVLRSRRSALAMAREMMSASSE
jgi:tRNA nucleotidyltransferase (CCA-adding enzyme)